MARVNQSAVRASMIEQLPLKDAERAVFVDQVDDYIELHKVKRRLIADIRKRGVVFTGKSSTGVEREMNNPSVKELLGVNRQMLAILQALGLTPNEAVADDDADHL